MCKTPQLVHFVQANTNNVKKIIRHEPSLQTTGGKDQPNIVFMRKS